MKALALFLAPVLLASSALAAGKPGCKDHPLFPTRMPGYSILDCKTEEFGVFEFKTTKRPTMPVEGRFTTIRYRVDDRKQEPSAVAVVRNYQDAITKAGGPSCRASPPGG